MEIPSNLVYANNSNNDTLHCDEGALLGTFGLFVQALLALAAFMLLILKRFFEPRNKRRSWKIWFYDTSKQAIGAAVIHFANVFLAGVFQGDPCTWYFISFLLDSTLGLLIIYLGIQVCQFIAWNRNYTSLIFGDYGNPPRLSAWLGQCGLYIVVMVVEKVLISLLLLLHFWKGVRELILYPVRDPQVELIVVMFIVPFFVNVLIFWVVDDFLKRKNWKNWTPAPIINSDASAERHFTTIERIRLYRNMVHSDSESDMLINDDEVGTGVARRLSEQASSRDSSMQHLVTAGVPPAHA